MSDATPAAVHYLPILTTVLAAIFLVVLLRRWLLRNRGAHLLWWALGIFTYGLGTALEGAITIFGNSVVLNKAWFIAGAFLGGYPLAQGTVLLLLQRRTALALTALSLPIVILGSIATAFSPIDHALLEAHRPGGAALEWQWVRLLTPIVNLYAAFFLIGGAILSAVRYARHRATRGRMIGNALIAFGALLPGIGGAMAKAGHVEALYVGEFVGLILIWIGYAFCVRSPRPAETLMKPSPRRGREIQAQRV